jgi:hypothetical protein
MVKIEDCKAMTDHFDGIDKLVKEAPHTEGAPNFRRVSLFWKPGVNFTNILSAALMHADPKSAKNTVKLSVSFALLGSTPGKALHKMLVKLTLGVNFTHSANVLAERVWRKQFHQQNCYQLASKHN